MKPAPFSYAAPHTVEEAVELLEAYGDDAKVLAGGQSLVPLLNMRLAQPKVLVDINAVEGFDEIFEEEGFVYIPMRVRHVQGERSPLLREKLPVVSEAVHQIGHPQIRNRGTMCGSVAHADPASELPAILMALDGRIVVKSRDSEEPVAPEDFFLTYLTTSLQAGQLVTALRFPLLPSKSSAAFLEFAQRPGDFALCGVAAYLHLDEAGTIAEARLALMGVGGTPFRAEQAEAVLQGERPSAALFAEAAETVSQEVDPDSDIHASAEYRRHLARVLTPQVLERAAARLGEER